MLTATTPKERIKSEPCLPEKPKTSENAPFGQSNCTTNLSTDYQILINYELTMCPNGLDNSIFSNCPHRGRCLFPHCEKELTFMAPSDALTRATQFSNLEHLISFVEKFLLYLEIWKTKQQINLMPMNFCLGSPSCVSIRTTDCLLALLENQNVKIKLHTPPALI